MAATNNGGGGGGGGGGGSGGNWLSGVNVVLVMAYGSLVFVLLFIFVKRQIMRFAMKSRRGPHVPVGHNAPKDLKEEIDIRLSKVQDVKYEPRLLAEDDARLLQLEAQGNQYCFNYLYRMKALDAIRTSEIPFHHVDSRHPRSLVGTSFRSYLLELRTSATPFKGVRKALVDTLLDGYETARYGTGALSKYDGLTRLPVAPSGFRPQRVPELPGGPAGAGRHRQGPGVRLPAAAPDGGQGPDSVARGSLALVALHHPGDVPPARPQEQEGQAFPGAEELQGQLQYTGKHPVTRHPPVPPQKTHPHLPTPPFPPHPHPSRPPLTHPPPSSWLFPAPLNRGGGHSRPRA
ncbi:protein C1orf43 homolog isoform X2 [Tachyglossus aculeatus]|uniref:protein C1orf43 homolog isoform X2 n=1 Tax=Tachyglossus aculeatus TaxID=9261 RepID=UPI0018F7C319|nr:protein C1orf43 homolog isoform X2 [Tachyglossus aculeatus]